MLPEQERRMVEVLQRLAEWNTQMLDDHPIQVLKRIVTDAEELLLELELPMYPVRPAKTMAPASEPSSETSEPSKTQPPEDR